jgi:hypothetical protein
MRANSAGLSDNTCKPTCKRVSHQAVVLCTSILVFLPSLLIAQQDDSIKSDASNHAYAISTPEQALERALLITGFSPRMKQIPTIPVDTNVVKLVTIVDDNTPFLADSVNGRQFWRVRLDAVDTRNQQAIDRGDDRWGRRNFDVTIDPRNGSLIWIQTDTRDTALPPEVSAASATAQLSEMDERYWGFVDPLPKVSFLEALHAASGCAAPIAVEILAQCVRYSGRGQTPRPIWIIVTRGVPQVEVTAMSHMADKSVRSRVRCAVDATSGDWLFMDCGIPHFDPLNIKQ